MTPPVGGHSYNGGMIPRFHRAVCGLRPIGTPSECFQMTAGVKTGKAQNERMFFRFSPQSGHRELASMCPLGAVKALRAAALHDGAGARVPGASDSRRGFRSYERYCAATAN